MSRLRASVPTAARSRLSRSGRARVSRLRARVRRRARSGAAGLGRGRRVDGRGRAPPFPYPEVAVVEEESLGEQSACRRARASRAAARARRLLLRAHRRRGGARRAPRTGRARLVRRARRPEHARDLAVRGSLGDAAPDAARRGAVEPDDVILLGARNLDPPEQEYVASIGLRTDPGELEVRHRWRPRCLRRARCRRARAGRRQAVHARARRPDPRGDRDRTRADPRPHAVFGAGLSRSCAADLERRAAHAPPGGAGPATPRRGAGTKLAASDARTDRRLDRAPITPRWRHAEGARTRTRARSASPTTATTSSPSICASARSAGTTSRCTRVSGSASSPTRAASPRTAEELRSDDPLGLLRPAARTPSAWPRPSSRPGSARRW